MRYNCPDCNDVEKPVEGLRDKLESGDTDRPTKQIGDEAADCSAKVRQFAGAKYTVSSATYSVDSVMPQDCSRASLIVAFLISLIQH
jgi:hypothetical protein